MHEITAEITVYRHSDEFTIRVTLLYRRNTSGAGALQDALLSAIGVAKGKKLIPGAVVISIMPESMGIDGQTAVVKPSDMHEEKFNKAVFDTVRKVVMVLGTWGYFVKGMPAIGTNFPARNFGDSGELLS